MKEADLTVTKWRCPICGTVNEDVFVLTAEPFCENPECGHEPSWENLLTPAEYRTLNVELKLYMEQS